MTTEVPQFPRRRRGLSAAVGESLRQLPTRRLVDPPPPTSDLQWSLVDLERYEVKRAGRTLGFIDVVGAVFVVLVGSRYDRAVEVLQTLLFDDALAAFGCGGADASPGALPR